MSDANPWFPHRDRSERLEVFCFPHAGGAAHAYASWRRSTVGSGLSVTAVQLPGRGGRIREPLVHSIEELADAAADAIASVVEGPFALFGHSFGALLAYEVTRRLTVRSLVPTALGIAASRAPVAKLTARWQVHEDEELLSLLRTLGGASEALLSHPRLTQLLLPVFRADLSADQDYALRTEPGLSGVRVATPIVAFSGRADPLVATEAVAQWSAVAGSSFDHHPVEGGHFFLDQPSVLKHLEAVAYTVPMAIGDASTGRRDEANGPISMSSEQRAMAVHRRRFPDESARYMICRSARFEGLEEDRWRLAVHAMGARWPILAAVEAGDVLRAGPVAAMTEIDPQPRSPDDVLQRVRSRITSPRDPNAPMLTTWLHRLVGGAHQVTVLADHLALDHVSLSVFIDELDRLYRDLRAALPATSPANALAQREAEFLKSDRAARVESQLVPRLREVPVLSWGDTSTDCKTTGFTAASRTVEAADVDWAVARSPFATAVVALGLVLDDHRRLGHGRLGMCAHSRDSKATSIGLGVNIVPLCLDLERDRSLHELTSRAAAAMRGALRARRLPAHRVARVLRELNAPDTAVFVNYMPAPRGSRATKALQALNADHDGYAFSWGDLKGVTTAVGSHGHPHDLTLNVIEGIEGSSPTLRLDFNAKVHSPGAIAALAERLSESLRALTATPSSPVADVLCVPASNREALVATFTRRNKFDDLPDVVAAFRAQAKAHPERAAVIESDGTVTTYQSLEVWAERIADALSDATLHDDEWVVAIELERSAAAFAAVLGALMAGATYLPLDPQAPWQRKRQLMELGAARAYIGAKAPDPRTGFIGLALTARDFAGGSNHGASSNAGRSRSKGYFAQHAQHAQRAAALLFTSGSTGTPKGVQVTHRNLSRSLFDSVFFDLAEGLRILSLTPWTFDISFYDGLGVIAHGGTSVQAPANVLDLAALTDVIRQHRPQRALFSTAVFHALVEAGFDPLADFERISVGGDVLSRSAVRRFAAIAPGVTLVNGYGPTEGTTAASCARVDGFNGRGSVPIGGPIDETALYITDDARRLVGERVQGELCLGGRGVARGYFDQPRLTAEKFVPDPYAAEPGARMYCTGDVCWVDGDQLRFVGRTDRQVQLRSVRVELGEVEAAVAAHPQVGGVYVQLEKVGQRPALVAHVCAPPTVEAELRSFVGDRLPHHSAPSFYVFVERLPLTAHGKVDRARLAPVRLASEEEARTKPRHPLEALLAELWCKALGCDAVPLDASLFDVGADSERVLHVHVALEKRLERQVPIGLFFEHSSIASMANALVELKSEAPSATERIHETASARGARRKQRQKQRRKNHS